MLTENQIGRTPAWHYAEETEEKSEGRRREWVRSSCIRCLLCHHIQLSTRPQALRNRESCETARKASRGSKGSLALMCQGRNGHFPITASFHPPQSCSFTSMRWSQGSARPRMVTHLRPHGWQQERFVWRTMGHDPRSGEVPQGEPYLPWDSWFPCETGHFRPYKGNNTTTTATAQARGNKLELGWESGKGGSKGRHPMRKHWLQGLQPGEQWSSPRELRVPRGKKGRLEGETWASWHESIFSLHRRKWRLQQTTVLLIFISWRRNRLWVFAGMILQLGHPCPHSMGSWGHWLVETATPARAHKVLLLIWACSFHSWVASDQPWSKLLKSDLTLSK